MCSHSRWRTHQSMKCYHSAAVIKVSWSLFLHVWCILFVSYCIVVEKTHPSNAYVHDVYLYALVHTFLGLLFPVLYYWTKVTVDVFKCIGVADFRPRIFFKLDCHLMFQSLFCNLHEVSYKIWKAKHISKGLVLAFNARIPLMLGSENYIDQLSANHPQSSPYRRSKISARKLDCLVKVHYMGEPSNYPQRSLYRIDKWSAGKPEALLKLHQRAFGVSSRKLAI